MCPGSNEGAGKRRKAHTRKGNELLRKTLTQAGQAAGRSKSTYLGATYRRIAASRGGKRATIAVGRNILEIAYHVLRGGLAYEELGVNYSDERKKEALVRNAVNRLERLGYKVTWKLSNNPQPYLAAWHGQFFGRVGAVRKGSLVSGRMPHLSVMT